MEAHADESQEEPDTPQGCLDVKDATGTTGPRLGRGVTR